MAEEKNSASAKSDTSAPAQTSSASSTDGQNGKGDAPRNCFTETYRSNYEAIDWSK